MTKWMRKSRLSRRFRSIRAFNKLSIHTFTICYKMSLIPPVQTDISKAFKIVQSYFPQIFLCSFPIRLLKLNGAIFHRLALPTLQQFLSINSLSPPTSATDITLRIRRPLETRDVEDGINERDCEERRDGCSHHVFGARAPIRNSCDEIRWESPI